MDVKAKIEERKKVVLAEIKQMRAVFGQAVEQRRLLDQKISALDREHTKLVGRFEELNDMSNGKDTVEPKLQIPKKESQKKAKPVKK